jgi:hypothetical protein
LAGLQRANVALSTAMVLNATLAVIARVSVALTTTAGYKTTPPPQPSPAPSMPP